MKWVRTTTRRLFRLKYYLGSRINRAGEMKRQSCEDDDKKELSGGGGEVVKREKAKRRLIGRWGQESGDDEYVGRKE